MNLRVKDIKWSRFYLFSEVYEYHGLFVKNERYYTKGKKRNKKTVNGIEGTPHSDNGFRLRSQNTGRKTFDNIPLKKSLSTLPCPLNVGDIGLYFIRIQIDQISWDYIGRSYEERKGIMDRLREHFIKIAGTTEGNFLDNTTKFSELKDKILKDYGINTNTPEFFDKYLRVAFLITDKNEVDKNEKNAKLEDLAFAFYKGVKGHTPNLNKIKEERGLENLSSLINN